MNRFVRPGVTALAVFLSSMVLVIVGRIPVSEDVPQMIA